ncbi:hypothetical protein IT412_02165 [Candidatus Peregrinibacteria bacterium]|nr:hypothetical protein [Candidatus Peregrinibacteria bacterium]
MKLSKLAVVLAGAMSLVGHASVVERKEVGNLIDETNAKLNRVLESTVNRSNNQVFEKRYPKLKKKLELDRQRSEADKKKNEKRIKERADSGKVFLKKLRTDYATMDMKEMIWMLEYLFQGPEDETFKKAHDVLVEQLGAIAFSNDKNAQLSDLEAIHRTFVPQGQRDDIKSSAVEFLASPMDSNLQNCRAAAKTLLLAILSKYPQMRNSVYFQVFDGHVRLIAEIDGKKKIFEWDKLVDFPDIKTQTKRNYVVPVDVYFAMTAKNTDKALIAKIQYYGPKVEANGVVIPTFTNETLPSVKLDEQLGRFADDDETERTLGDNMESKSRSEVKLKPPIYDVIFPAEANVENVLPEETGRNIKALIKLDKISLNELKQLDKLKLVLPRLDEIYFTGIKSMSNELLDMIVTDFGKIGSFYFEDLEEIDDMQMRKLVTPMEYVNQKKIHFKKLKSISEKKLETDNSRYLEINLLESDFGQATNYASNGINQQNHQIKPALMDLTFDELTSMSPGIAKWLGKQTGNIAFGHKANLTVEISKYFRDFEDNLFVENSQAISLVKGLEGRKGDLVYSGWAADPEMINALAKYTGRLVGNNPFAGETDITDKMFFKRMDFLRDMVKIGQTRGEIILQVRSFDRIQTYRPKEGLATAKNTTTADLLYAKMSDFRLHIQTSEESTEYLTDIRDHKGHLILEYFGLNNTAKLLDSLRSRQGETTVLLNEDIAIDTLLEQIHGFNGPFSIDVYSKGNMDLEQKFSDEVIRNLEKNNNAKITFIVKDVLTPDKFDSIIEKMNSKSKQIKFQIKQR